jgi:hypothetical protein
MEKLMSRVLDSGWNLTVGFIFAAALALPAGPLIEIEGTVFIFLRATSVFLCVSVVGSSCNC